MADTCAGNGATTCSAQKNVPFMDTKFLSHVALPILCLTPLATFLLFPLLWRAAGAFLGWYLRKKTDGRRCHILELVEADEKKYREIRRSSNSSGGAGEDGGWEKVDAYTTGTARNGAQGDDDWDGIVGFFHPFW
jgi:alpha-1,2-mannosyltransferase